MQRRGFLIGAIAALAAPAVIRTPGLLMPVKALIPTGNQFLTVDEISRRCALLMRKQMDADLLDAMSYAIAGMFLPDPTYRLGEHVHMERWLAKPDSRFRCVEIDPVHRVGVLFERAA